MKQFRTAPIYRWLSESLLSAPPSDASSLSLGSFVVDQWEKQQGLSPTNHVTVSVANETLSPGRDRIDLKGTHATLSLTAQGRGRAWVTVVAERAEREEFSDPQVKVETELKGGRQGTLEMKMCIR